MAYLLIVIILYNAFLVFCMKTDNLASSLMFKFIPFGICVASSIFLLKILEVI